MLWHYKITQVCNKYTSIHVFNRFPRVFFNRCNYKTGTQIILGNTYHLLLRPGLETLLKFGGVSEFMNWKKPILTDSGGFQVMSLSKLRKITKKGVKFQSHIDGAEHILTPENVIDSQNIIKSDIQIVLDECTQYPETH